MASHGSHRMRNIKRQPTKKEIAAGKQKVRVETWDGKIIVLPLGRAKRGVKTKKFKRIIEEPE